MKIFRLTMTLIAALCTSQVFADYFSTNDVSVEVVSHHGSELPTFPVYQHTRMARDKSLLKTYVQAQPEQRYAIRIHNHSGERVGVVIAVDGRNIISGKHSKLKSKERKYVLGPYQTATYRGWRSSKNSINEFYFTHEENSYSAAFGDYSAMGVIAVAVFRDKDRYAYQNHHEEDRFFGNSSRDNSAAKPAPTARADKSGHESESQPGTGYGNERYSRSRQVAFNEERHASAKFLIKYEWRETLCERGIARCHVQRDGNRLWDNHSQYDHRVRYSQYAPPPPKSRWNSRFPRF